MTCQRCGRDTRMLTCSWFNTEMICFRCDERERAHPRFDYAREVELAACKRGDFNFKGIGLPSDLRPADLRVVGGGAKPW